MDLYYNLQNLYVYAYGKLQVKYLNKMKTFVFTQKFLFLFHY